MCFLSVNISFVFFFCYVKQISRKSEMNFKIRFKKKRNEFQNSFVFFLFRNRIRDPFQKSMKPISKFISEVSIFFLWNGFWDPFHIVLKGITNSISQILNFFPEMEFVISFKKLWNGFQNSFHKFSCYFMKRISRSSSYFSETNHEFCF